MTTESKNTNRTKSKRIHRIALLLGWTLLCVHCIPSKNAPFLQTGSSPIGPQLPREVPLEIHHFPPAANKVQARLVWAAPFTDAGFGSPGCVDLNNDGVLDVVIGGGKERGRYNREIVALDGASGQRLWSYTIVSRVFASPLFLDITNDAIADVIIGTTNNPLIRPQKAQDLLAIDGSDGTLIWSLNQVNAARPLGIEIGEGNFGTPVMTSDLDNDGIADLVVIQSGGNIQSRPPAKIFIVSTQSGNILDFFHSHDKAESYATPSINGFISPTRLIIGTGGETLAGSISEIEISNKQLLWSLDSPTKGFIASPLIYQNPEGEPQLVTNTFDATTYKINAQTGKLIWKRPNPGYQTYSSPVVGHFNHDDILDVFTQYNLGSWPKYTKNMQIWFDGKTGHPISTHTKDRFGSASPSVLDIDHDGLDEILTTTTSGPYGDQSHLTLFAGDTHQPLFEIKLGQATAVTPFVVDIDNNNQVDIVTGFGNYIFRLELKTPKKPRVRWGSFRGSHFNGTLHKSPK